MARTRKSLGHFLGIADFIGVASICRSLGLKEVRRALDEAGVRTLRHRDLPAEAVVYYVVAMALFMHVNLREVLFCLMEGLRTIRGAEIRITGKSGISQARSRIGAAPLRCLYERQVRPIATSKTRGAWYLGLRLVSLDSSTLDLPDEPANRETFHGPSTFNDRCPFPQLRFVCLAEVGTRVLFGAKMAGYHVGERTLAREVVPLLRPGMLCLADRGFFSHELWNATCAMGADLLWRAPAAVDLPVIRALPDGSYLSRLWSRRARRKGAGPVTVRVVQYKIDGVRDAKKVSYRLVTTLLDHREAPAEELAGIYQQRWEIETAFDELKTHLRGSRMCLRSKTPELVRQEFYGLMLAHFVVRNVMHEASRKVDVDPDALSFTHSLRAIRRKLTVIPALSP